MLTNLLTKLKTKVNKMLKNKVIEIIKENDSITISELLQALEENGELISKISVLQKFFGLIS